MAKRWPEVLTTYQELADYLRQKHDWDVTPGTLSSLVYKSRKWLKDHAGQTLPAGMMPVPRMDGRTPTWPRAGIDAWRKGEDQPEQAPAAGDTGDLVGYERLADYLRDKHQWEASLASLAKLVERGRRWIEENPRQTPPMEHIPAPQVVGRSLRWSRSAIDAWQEHLASQWKPLQPLVPAAVALEALERLAEGAYLTASEYATIGRRVREGATVRGDWRAHPSRDVRASTG